MDPFGAARDFGTATPNANAAITQYEITKSMNHVLRKRLIHLISGVSFFPILLMVITFTYA